MKTTINLPDELVGGVMREYPGVTKTSLVIMGLERLSGAAKFRKMQGLKGKLKINIPLDTLRDRHFHKWKPHAAR